ncbi:MAG TPA: Rne/Rng family ribonuclease [Streptosporangiaceae bacterium]|nr:Rne/Rng family ribonuclease [Streptosporangiaceae bacterium]
MAEPPVVAEAAVVAEVAVEPGPGVGAAAAFAAGIEPEFGESAVSETTPGVGRLGPEIPGPESAAEDEAETEVEAEAEAEVEAEADAEDAEAEAVSAGADAGLAEPQATVSPEGPGQEWSVQDTPVQDTPVQEPPAQESPAQEAPAQEAPAQEAPSEEQPAKAPSRRRRSRRSGSAAGETAAADESAAPAASGESVAVAQSGADQAQPDAAASDQPSPAFSGTAYGPGSASPAFSAGVPGTDQSDATSFGSALVVPGQPATAAIGTTAPGAAVPAATFQPPVVIFQPPDIESPRPPAPVQGGRRADEAEEAPADSADDGQEQASSEDDGESSSRRRRRGGRGHGKARSGGEDTAESAAQPDGAATEASTEQAAATSESEVAGDDDSEDGSAAGRRRRRRRRSGTSGEASEVAPDDPPNTVTHVRPARAASADISDVRAVRGSTRLEAKRQRRREGRESGRRRPPIITESEFLARREAVQRVMVVRQRGDRTQIAVLEDGTLVEHYVDKASHQSYVGNVYLGKVQNVLPSMEAAFVDIGKGRNAVLYAGEVNFDASGLEGESKRIESALKSGQSILVQVTKDPIGHKGARLTSQISLPGRYLVYVPGASMTGISRKLPDTERTRLKQILKQVMPDGAGVIVRTAAEGASEEELARDVSRLAAQWEAIERKSKTASAPDLLYSEPDLTIRVVRDIFNEDFGKLVIASDGEWDIVDEYVRYVAPHLAERMERWQDDNDVFAAYRIDEQLAKALERKVWLPSGGSLVIDPTEAMTVIDVNTGKFTGQGGNLEQTVTRNNLEAAEEIVRQLRLRDVGGIIVIDFIDMVLESNRELVLRRLLECLARDRTKHQVAEVTSLGLVQMTRKRVGSGLLEAFSTTCEHCNGRGVLLSMEPVDHDHGPSHDDNRSKDDGKSRGGRGSRNNRQSRGDGSRDGSRDSGGRDSGSRDSGSRDSGSRDSGGRDGNGHGGNGGNGHGGSRSGGQHGGDAHQQTAPAQRDDQAQADAPAPADTADAAGHGNGSRPDGGSGGSGSSGRTRARGRAVRSAGPANPEFIAEATRGDNGAVPVGEAAEVVASLEVAAPASPPPPADAAPPASAATGPAGEDAAPVADGDPAPATTSTSRRRRRSTRQEPEPAPDTSLNT